MTGHEWKAFRDMLYGRDLSEAAKMVGMYILSYRNPANGLCCPSMERIGRDMGRTRAFVQEHVNELVASGVLLKTRKQRHNEYQWAACPPPGLYRSIYDASQEELRELVEDVRRRQGRRTIVDRSPFTDVEPKWFAAQKDEEYRRWVGGFPVDYGSPAEWVPSDVERPLPF